MEKNMFKKTLVIGIIVLFFGTGIGAGLDKIEYKNNEKNLLSRDDELDQYQTIFHGLVGIGANQDIQYAQ